LFESAFKKRLARTRIGNKSANEIILAAMDAEYRAKLAGELAIHLRQGRGGDLSEELRSEEILGRDLAAQPAHHVLRAPI